MKQDWINTSIGGTATFNYGKSLTRSNRSEGNVPVYGSSGISGYHNQALVHQEGIIVGRKGNVGSIYFSGSQFYPIDTVYYITQEDLTCDLRFFYYLLKNINLRKLNSDSAVPGLNREAAYSQGIEIPKDRNLQIRVASTLSAYDELIENNEKRIKILEEMAQRLYTEWFVHFRFPGYEKVKMADSGTEYGMIPEGWNVFHIGSKFKTVLGGTPSRANIDYWEKGTIPWINSGKVNELRIIEPSELITEKALQKSATKIMPVRTTLLAITGATLGQVSLTEIECCANQSVVGIYDENGLLNEYLYLFIKKNINGIVNLAGGGAQQHINKDIVNNSMILIPDRQTVIKFFEKAKPIFDIISVLIFLNLDLKKTRDLLIPQLVTGRRGLKNG